MKVHQMNLLSSIITLSVSGELPGLGLSRECLIVLDGQG